MPKRLSYPERKPSESELEYFRANPHVGGMMSQDPEDDQYVMSPFTKLTPEQLDAVRLNEQARIYMRRNGSPEFELTPQQEEFLNSTTYAKASPEERRATIAARILSNDNSARKPTEQQLEYVNKLRQMFLGEEYGR